jgi:uncharacterized protein
VNRLAKESSPYLRQHRDNPVDWYPWGDEALERARREDKPILLSVGYSACHWCHVMAHESFEDPGTAQLMNERFVNIKVDREERPDLDQLYQGVVQLIGRGGGWPLTVFLTPKLRPFFGGTYFPVTDRYGMPGFRRLLTGLSEAYVKTRKDIEEQADQFEAGLTHLAAYGLDAAPADFAARDVVAAAERLERETDKRHGGFGSAPKFPNPMNVALLLRGWRRSKKPELLSAALLALEKMAMGGVYDQLGGGFHRYSVDESWSVPHFEKMLYDNGQLLHLYAEAQQISPRPLWKKVCEETVEWVAREMTSPQGAFYSAQDADSEGEEGKFFVFTPEQVSSPLLRELFGVKPGGNFEEGATVLALTREPGEGELDAFRKDRAALWAEREKRVKPGLDDKVLAGWNGLMIRGLAFASRVFGRPDWAKAAARAADFVLAEHFRDGALIRTAKIPGFAEDYGDFTSGLTALYQATFERRYLDAAAQLLDKAVALFWDDQRQAYLSAPKGQKDLLCPTYALHDNAFPSGASTLTEAGVALAALTEQPRHLEQAEKYIRRMRDEAIRNPFGYGHLLLAADAYVDGAAALTLAGEATALQAQVNATYAPTIALDVTPGREGRENGAYLCRRFSCLPPVREADALKELLEAV